jgi:hypothetical protein
MSLQGRQLPQLADRQASHKPHLLDLFLLAKRPEVIPLNKRKKLPKNSQL